MPSKTDSGISPKEDLRKVRSLVTRGGFEEMLAKLDPANVAQSLREVPVEMVRLIAAFGLAGDAAELRRVLGEDRSKTVKLLVEAAEKERIQEFVKALVRQMDKDPAISRRLGIPSGDRAQEARQFNAVTNVRWAPQMMLFSKRVYIDLMFMQGEDVLFKTKAELDDLLRMISLLLKAAKGTADLLAKDMIGCKLLLQSERCADAISNMRSVLPQILKSLRLAARVGAKRKRASKAAR